MKLYQTLFIINLRSLIILALIDSRKSINRQNLKKIKKPMKNNCFPQASPIITLIYNGIILDKIPQRTLWSEFCADPLLWCVVVAVCLFALSADICMAVMTVQSLTNYLSHRVIDKPCGGIWASRSDKLTCQVILIAGGQVTVS